MGLEAKKGHELLFAGSFHKGILILFLSVSYPFPILLRSHPFSIFWVQLIKEIVENAAFFILSFYIEENYRKVKCFFFI